jgi:RND family efflux transporter MFP subunit
MEDKSSLLAQLRIDRGSAGVEPASGTWKWAAALAGAAILGLAAWFALRPSGVPVRIAVARATSGAAAPTASVLDASGYVVARRQATVASKITAKMVELDIEEGDHVSAGQTIARLDDTNIRAALDQAHAQLDYAKAGLAETEVNLANAERDYDRQKSLLLGHFVSQAAVDAAQTTFDALRAQLATQRSNVQVVARALNSAERNLDDTIVRAPFAGVVTVKAAQPGEMVSPISAGGGFTRTGIGTIVDMDSLEFQVDVNENFINRVRAAQPVTAKLNAYPDWQIPAHVIALIPTADRSKGTVMVRIAIDAKDPRILPEMGVRVAFLADKPEPAASTAGQVSLPTAAVRGTGAAGTVFVVHDDSVERRAVRLGASGGGEVVVTAGLAAGTRVAVGDLTKLEDGTRIRIEP